MYSIESLHALCVGDCLSLQTRSSPHPKPHDGDDDDADVTDEYDNDDDGKPVITEHRSIPALSIALASHSSASIPNVSAYNHSYIHEEVEVISYIHM